ncbi:hypothetical protein C1H46_021081 [Malus baccata]|uniref:Uncharacterized protein n=1 Tax=Malus baccata TaxID=106549 RepID=A0A540M3K4_MALBA|nr:hypothetical protein C1H46_021081 [Malus baccata]
MGLGLDRTQSCEGFVEAIEEQGMLGLIEQSFISRYSLRVHEDLIKLPESFTITDDSIFPGG